jgi:hypothetical protein
VFFRVAARKNGTRGPWSRIVRTQPRFPIEVAASIRSDGTVDVEWSASRDASGYNLYAAAMEVGDKSHYRSMRDFGEVERLNSKPLTERTFHDARRLASAKGMFNHEMRGYVVKAVNAFGVESGPSTMALTLAGSVPDVTATERPDGSTLIEWQPVAQKHIRGYAVYRMDEYRPSVCIRVTPHPLKQVSYTDWNESPRAERRRYYVVAVDALGQIGEPSTGAWAFGRP